MKTIRISKSVLSSSSFRNSCAYLSRSARIASDKNVCMDRTLPDHTRPWADQADRLQYYLRYSNCHISPDFAENFMSAAQGRVVKAELMEEEASALQTRASILRRRAETLQVQSVLFSCRRYLEDAHVLSEEAEFFENEASYLYDNAADYRRTADQLYWSAVEADREDAYISRWEEIYDMM